MTKEAPVSPQPEFVKDEDFASLYANHVWFESSAWDLNLIFGQLEPSKGPNTVRQHTAIAISWMQAKLLAHFIEVNVVLHEGKSGKVEIPPYLRPPEISPLSADEDTDPVRRETNRRLRDLRHRFLESLDGAS